MGVFTTQPFKKGDFLLHYAGDLLNGDEAEKKEKMYNKAKKGSYMYYFIHEGKHQW